MSKGLKQVIEKAIQAASKDGLLSIDEFVLIESISKVVNNLDNFGFEREMDDATFERKKRELVENLILLITEDEQITPQEEEIFNAVIEELFRLMREKNEP